MNSIVRNISALSIVTTGQLPKLSKGQQALLNLIRDCVDKRRSLTFDLMVKVYYDHVRKTFTYGTGWQSNPDDWTRGKYSQWHTVDIMDAYHRDFMYWKWRPNVRTWFCQNVGILVVKNQLVIIPTIDLGAEDEKENG